MSGFDSFFSKAAASVKVLAKDAMQGTASLVNKVQETDVQGVARRLTHKVMEKADSNFANVEELPEVESAMLNLKQTDAAYRELHAVLLDSFVAQARASNRQLRAANRADVIGRDIEGERTVGQAMSTFGNHLTVTAERNQELNNVKDAAEIEEKARDDFEGRVYDTPASRLVSSLGAFLQGELASALAARTRYKDSRREVSIYVRKASEFEGKGMADKAEEAKKQAEEGTKVMEEAREELLRQFMVVEQRKPALQTVLQSYLQAQLQYHQQCLLSCDNALTSISKTSP